MAPQTTADRASRLIAAASYLLLALCLWLPYGPSNGMSYETVFPWTSETTAFPASMQFIGDPLRVYTGVFYDLGYRLSQILQIPGSYLGNQIVFLFLLWARGYFLYLGLAALIPEAPWLAFLSGAFALVDGSDYAAMWVGQLNQLGYMFWLVLAFYSLVRATEVGEWRHQNRYAALAVASCYFCLFSYESPIFLVVLLPFLLAWIRWEGVKYNAVLFLLWYSIPALLTYRILWRWSQSTPTYQRSVMRSDFFVSRLLSDWSVQVEQSFAFWNWGGAARQPEHAIYAYAAAVVFVLSCYLLLRVHKFQAAVYRRIALRGLPAGLLVCAFSFPAYLLLVDGGGLWRTQFLSSFGFGIAMSSLLLLVAATLNRRPMLVIALAGAVVVHIGVHALVDTSKGHFDIWERYRRVISQILVVAPRLQAGSVVVLSGVPNQADPFGHNMWFDMGVRLAYPRQAVSGIYFLRDGKPSPAQNLKLEVATGQWKWTRWSIQPLVTAAPAGRTIFLELNGDGKLNLLAKWPSWLPAPEEVRQAYDPGSVILQGEPSPIAVNRYRPLPKRGTD